MTGKYDLFGECRKDCGKYGILFIVDAFPNRGSMGDRCTKNMGFPSFVFTGHKGLMGPQGTGGMYVKSGVKIRPLLSGGSGIDSYNMHHPSQMPEALEAGTRNGHGLAGLSGGIVIFGKRRDGTPAEKRTGADAPFL